MRPFLVDDEVVSIVWARAKPKPFENLNFNNALRRTLGIPEVPVGDSGASHPDAEADELDAIERLPTHLPRPDSSTTRRRSKAPRADFRRLTRDGLVRNGEELFLVDYQGQRIKHSKVTIAGAYLQHQGRVYSMSDLAQIFLKKEGYSSASVRGPAHWVNSNDVSIKDLWQKILDKHDPMP